MQEKIGPQTKIRQDQLPLNIMTFGSSLVVELLLCWRFGNFYQTTSLYHMVDVYTVYFGLACALKYMIKKRTLFSCSRIYKKILKWAWALIVVTANHEQDVLIQSRLYYSMIFLSLTRFSLYF